MNTPTDFLRALGRRLGIKSDRRVFHREARFFIAAGGEIRNEEAIARRLSECSPEDLPALRRILGISSMIAFLAYTPTGEGSSINPHPRSTKAESAAARSRGNDAAGTVITGRPSRHPAGIISGVGASATGPRGGYDSPGLRPDSSILAGQIPAAARHGRDKEPRHESVRPIVSGARVGCPDARGKRRVGSRCLVDKLASTKAPPAYTIASWYGDECAGRPMANGMPFDPVAMTCASWHHKLGTRLIVSRGGRSVVVTVTDRGPAKRLNRGIDLSRAAFNRIAPLEDGLTSVKITVL